MKLPVKVKMSLVREAVTKPAFWEEFGLSVVRNSSGIAAWLTAAHTVLRAPSIDGVAVQRLYDELWAALRPMLRRCAVNAGVDPSLAFPPPDEGNGASAAFVTAVIPVVMGIRASWDAEVANQEKPS